MGPGAARALTTARFGPALLVAVSPKSDAVGRGYVAALVEMNTQGSQPVSAEAPWHRRGLSLPCDFEGDDVDQ